MESPLPDAFTPAAPFWPYPETGRVFAAARVVRSTEVTPSGRLRFDSLARYLQDVAEDDVADAGLREPVVWLLRRCAVSVAGFPQTGAEVALRTFCSATGPRWAERTTTVAGRDGDLLQARALWVAVARASGQPVALSSEFHRIYGPATEGREVSARLTLPRPPRSPRSPRSPGPGAADAEDADSGRPWPLRASDFDTAGHVNNSVHWAAVEDVLAGLGWLPALAELEYPRAIKPGCRPRLTVGDAVDETGGEAPGEVCAWLLDGVSVLAAARLAR